MRRSSVLLVALVTLSMGCAPRCVSVCKKLLDCGLDSERVSQSECEEGCQREGALYDDWEDEEKIQAFKDHKRCIRASTCAELADGACYDPLLFIVDTEGS